MGEGRVGLRFLCTMDSPEIVQFLVVWILPVGAPRVPWAFEEKKKSSLCLPCLCPMSMRFFCASSFATHCCQARDHSLS